MMLRLAALFAGTIAASLATAGSAQTVLNFDSGIGNFGSLQSYGGLDWSNFLGFDTSNYLPSGYVNGTVSPNFVVFNGFADPASITSSADFRLVSGYLTGAWNDGLTVTVNGFNNSALVYTQNFVVNTTGPSFVTFNNALVDNVVFSSDGGTNAGLSNAGTHFALDNLTIGAAGGPGAVPEPASWAMLIAGFGLTGATMRRRRVVAATA